MRPILYNIFERKELFTVKIIIVGNYYLLIHTYSKSTVIPTLYYDYTDDI